ncbi:MAG: hypothetical protein V1809_13585 [Planctomycetota bacterium]
MRHFLCVVLAAGFVSSVLAGASAPPLKSEDGFPAISFGDIAAGDVGGGWGGVQTEGDIKYRVAAKGGEKTFKVKAWWAAGALRPAENTVYVMTVYYKDTAKTPVSFASYGNPVRHMERLHRFGGTGDGRWKTAAVPVGWDNLLRLPGDREHTSFGITADEDLPVSAITMRRAVKSDEEAFNSETRAWVAGAQSNRGKDLALKIEPPAFTAPAKELVVFPWPAMAVLQQNGQPKTEQIGAPVKIRMCLNEIEGGSFGVYAHGADLKGVNYTVSELRGPSGVLKADVVRRTAEYCLVQARENKLRWFPLRLWPAYPVDIEKGRSHWFLFNLKTRRGEAKPGLYKGEVTITAGGARGALPLEVEVLPVDLLTMEEAGLTMGGCTTGLVPIHDISFQADYNQNGTNLWIASISPEMSVKDGKLVVDWTYLDDWMQGAKKRGLTNIVWFLGGNPYGFPSTMSLQRELYRLQAGGGKDSNKEFVKKMNEEGQREKILSEVRPLFVDFNRQLYTHSKEAGWPEIVVTPFDEPAKWRQTRKDKSYADAIGTGSWIKPKFKEDCAAIREGAPKMPIYGSIHHAVPGLPFLGDVDIFCTNAIGEDAALGDKVRAGGKTFWQYTGVFGGGEPGSARFTFGFFFGSYDSRGSLCWAYNWGQGFDTSEGDNWLYAWQTPFDTIPSPYFEGVREAWDDRRVIETYKKKFANDAEAMGALDAIFKAAQKSQAGGGRDLVNEFWTAIDDAGKLGAWRNQLLDHLVKAGSPPK